MSLDKKSGITEVIKKIKKIFHEISVADFMAVHPVVKIFLSESHV